MVTKYGHVWKRIADELPGRTPIMIKNRYHFALCKKINGTEAIGSIEKKEKVYRSKAGEESIDDIKEIMNVVTQEIKRLHITSQ